VRTRAGQASTLITGFPGRLELPDLFVDVTQLAITVRMLAVLPRLGVGL
jgi:hypothetical protein